MSRLRRLKENRRKNTIKTTMASLALVLAIGSTQVMGTYALFTDSENLPDEIALSTGDVDVKVGKGATFEGIQPGSNNSYIYTITNQGTLRQQIKLNVDIPTTVDDATLNSALNYLKREISYSADFGIKQSTEEGVYPIPVPDNEVGEGVAKIDNIKLSEEKILTNLDGNIFVLEPGQQITVNATINIPDMDLDSDGVIDQNIQDALNKIGPIALNVKVEARQISNDITKFIDYGFYDIEVQENTINIGEFNVAPDKAVIIDKLGNEKQRIRIYESLIGISNRAKEFKLIESTGLFSGCKFSEHQDTITIEDIKVYDKDNEKYLFGDNYGVDTVTIGYKEDNIDKQVKFDFVYNHDIHGNERVIVRYTITNSSKTKLKSGEIIATIEEPSESEVVEPPKEEVVVQSEPEVVEPPKEEVVAPSEPEVVEPPKEEVVAPSKPDIIAPSKEEIEIQE